MSLLNRFIAYYKDNPEGYWFKAKLFGWGWVPVKWQGWLAILLFIAFLLWNGVDLSAVPEPADGEVSWFFIRIIVAVAILIAICYIKGEKPRWQWGIPDDSEKSSNISGQQK